MERMFSKPRARQPTKKEKQDDSIMNTNNSCIVSKRCVEKIYHVQDHGFLRYFVKKFQRRSPLISRGYWLRMRAIETVVRTFLQQDPSRPKVVVNLGCGYDPLPFQFLSKPALCESATFVDVDYPQLMRQKAKIIKETKALSDVLCNLQSAATEKDPILLSSSGYLAVACDLEDFGTVETVLKSLGSDQCNFLFVAEVSLTYMDEKAAEAVIRGASRFERSHFCLLEQFLPGGIGHPFAETMLGHFEKLNSHLKSVTRFPALRDQKSRFAGNGWPAVKAKSLWDLWLDLDFVSIEERRQLDRVEPFDEWEEFALFASHYFVLTASTLGQTNILDQMIHPRDSESQPLSAKSRQIESQLVEGSCRRRMAVSAQIGEDQVVLHGGQGTQGRLRSPSVVLKTDSNPETPFFPDLPVECHSVTKLESGSFLLVGGRTSPDNASNKCFLVDRNGYSAAMMLPRPLYRHSTVHLESDKVLVFGGKHDALEVCNQWLLWDTSRGWTALSPQGDIALGLFGASMAVTGRSASTISGVLMGGIEDTGCIMTKAWTWTFDIQAEVLTCSLNQNLGSGREDFDVFRFGASLIMTQEGLLLSGGVGVNGTISAHNELVLFDRDLQTRRIEVKWQHKRPMLIGCTVENLLNNQILIAGGGATCFSFGTHWNIESHVLLLNGHAHTQWQFMNEGEVRPTDTAESSSHLKPRKQPKTRKTLSNGLTGSPKKSVDRVRLSTSQDFDHIVEKSKPVIIEGVDLGCCTTAWTTEYLKSKSPLELLVTVHDSTSPNMSFLDKNFAYKSLPFTDFLSAVSHPTNPAPMYLRAISTTSPTTTPTTLAADFPFLATDFTLPPTLHSVTANLHSSPLRISGPVAMWLHYDVLANIYCQIRGSKRLLLYPPSAVAHLSFPHGASASRLSPFATNPAALPPPHLECFAATLAPGDVLYIPPFWAHAAAAPEDGVSVAVNVFFRNLRGAHVYAAGRDTYANRDLAAYENGRKAVGRIAAGFKGLPRDARVFYLRRLARELEEAAKKGDGEGGEWHEGEGGEV